MDQDKMRVVKQRLLELLPTARVFLDVDDLADISNLGDYIRRSSVVLVCCSSSYCESRNCMIELRTAVIEGKPLIALLDPDGKHGSINQVAGAPTLTSRAASHHFSRFSASLPLRHLSHASRLLCCSTTVGRDDTPSPQHRPTVRALGALA